MVIFWDLNIFAGRWMGGVQGIQEEELIQDRK